MLKPEKIIEIWDVQNLIKIITLFSTCQERIEELNKKKEQTKSKSDDKGEEFIKVLKMEINSCITIINEILSVQDKKFAKLISENYK
jgi:hypothetical protein